MFPLCASVQATETSKLVKPAWEAAGGRLAVTESGTPGVMWVWARTQADADAAAQAMPVLVFADVRQS